MESIRVVYVGGSATFGVSAAQDSVSVALLRLKGNAVAIHPLCSVFRRVPYEYFCCKITASSLPLSTPLALYLPGSEGNRRGEPQLEQYPADGSLVGANRAVHAVASGGGWSFWSPGTITSKSAIRCSLSSATAVALRGVSGGCGRCSFLSGCRPLGNSQGNPAAAATSCGPAAAPPR